MASLPINNDSMVSMLSGELSLSSSNGSFVDEGSRHEPQEHHLSQSQVIMFACISILLVIGAGIFSGLTLAIFSIDAVHLRVEARTGDNHAKRRATRLLSLIDRHHLTLVTLLISNASCMTALPIFLEELLDPVPALIVSITAVVFFGEIFPQATFVKFAVPVSYFFCYLVWALIVLTFVISWPFSKLLDLVVGHKSSLMERAQLGEFFRLHGDDGGDRPLEGLTAGGISLSKTEVAVMQGALKMSTHTVGGILKVSTQETFMLSSSKTLDKETVKLILMKGYSRVPIYKDEDRRHILGCLLVKSLLPLAFKFPNPAPLCGEYPLTEVVRASTTWLVQDLYAAFEEGQTHMAVVYNNRGRMEGVITLEDVFELLHSVELEDEYDHRDDEGNIIGHDDDCPHHHQKQQELVKESSSSQAGSPLTVLSNTSGLGSMSSRRSTLMASDREKRMLEVYGAVRDARGTDQHIHRSTGHRSTGLSLKARHSTMNGSSNGGSPFMLRDSSPDF